VIIPTLDKSGVPFKPGLRSTTGTASCIIMTSLACRAGIIVFHHIQFQDTRILVTRTRRMERIIREAREVEFYPGNMNKEEGLSLIRPWKLLLQNPE